MSSTVRTAAAALGLLALIAAAVLAFVVVPGRAQLPADTDSTRLYDGQVAVLLDSAALAAGDLANAVVRDLPVQIEQNVVVTDVADGVADVTDAATVTLPDGTPLLETAANFDVDRRTMEAQGEAAGLVIGWPINPDAADTVGWSGPLQSTVPFVYEATETHAGIETLRFTGTETGSITDEAWLATVPDAVPSAMLGLLAGALDAPAAVTDQLAAAGDLLPAEVPLTYAIDATTTYWVHPATGMVIDAAVAETRTVALDLPGFDTTPVASVLDLSYQGAPDSVASVVTEAEDLAGQLSLFGSVLPIGLTVAGVLLLGLAFAGRRRGDDTEIDLTASEIDLADAEVRERNTETTEV